MHFEFLSLENGVTITLTSFSHSARPIVLHQHWFIRETSSHILAIGDFYPDGPLSENKQHRQGNHRRDAHNTFHAAAPHACPTSQPILLSSKHDPQAQLSLLA
jgi:hypothetical protein